MKPASVVRVHQERGVALLISIFALVLISGVAVSLIMMSRTETALNANYQRNVKAFYAANAGLEEARYRLVPCAPPAVQGGQPESLWPQTACAIPPVSVDPLFNFAPPSVVGQALYIVNPSATDLPFDPRIDPGVGPTSQYYDWQYEAEFGEKVTQAGARVVQSSRIMNGNIANLPPLPYKWVRINLKSEVMGGLDLNGDAAVNEGITPVRAQGNDTQCITNTPGCSTDPNATITSAPVYRITALAIDPSGSERMVQAEVAMPPVFNPNGAISSKAGVSINGNFNAFGAWPPVVSGRCGNKTIQTCGYYGSKGAVEADCNNPYDPATDTCNGKPRSHKDYCDVGDGVNGVSSAGAINSGNYDEVPDASGSCQTTGAGCIFTAAPNDALSPNQANWPYDMDQIINQYRPPNTEPLTNVPGVTCGAYDQAGNRKCDGQGVQIGTLPNPWPVPPNTTATNNDPKYVFAETGPEGVLKLTGASSGSGLLVVEGNLEVQAGFQWYGLIVVRGVVSFSGGGATPTNVIGGIIAGESVTNASTTVGGSVSVIYSSCAYRNSVIEQPLRYLGFREISRPRR